MNETDPIEPELVEPGDDDQASQALGGEIAIASEILPSTLHLLPLSERPFFPAQALPLLLNEEAWLETVQKVGEAPQHAVGLLLSRAENTEESAPSDFHAVGTVARMYQPMRASGKIQFIAEGLRRFRVVRWLQPEAPYLAQVEYLDDHVDAKEAELRAYAMALISAIKELLPLNPLYSEELKNFANRFSPNEPSTLADFAASLTTADKEELQAVLETLDVRQRMEKVLILIRKEIEVARLQAKISQQVEDKMTEQQRQFFLREQLKMIQKELGLAKDDRTADIDRFRGRLEALTLPEQAQQRIDEELEKLAILESGSPEYAVTRNYLDTLTALPWGLHSEDKLDLDAARKILDRDHDGLDDVKDRIIEFLAVGALTQSISGSILLLVGPPGVGKTSIGRSIATALGRKFFRFSLGGMRDEAEIKGHRRTYIGAMPGKFIQAIKEVGVANPLIMLDEIDKVGASYQGDPASALLEVLDPEQNSEFLDHFLDVRFDLSKVLFVCTANQLDTIPAPLFDRMETIRLGGYITAEKLVIAKNHLWPRQLERMGVKRSKVKISDAALRRVIEGYAREAGVRGLEKRLSAIIRKAVVKIVGGETGTIRIGQQSVEAYLGRPPFRPEQPLSGIGVVTGLAWTPVGGTTLSIEASQVHAKQRGFKLTGKLGEVMRESAEIAYSYVAAHLEQFGAPADFLDNAFIHLHVPEGATPKDGPSAGVTMATALLSLARKRKPRSLAMTGELTLTGQVLPVGGIREKVIAARRIKIRELILPESNRGDFEELPDHIRDGITVHFASDYPDVAEVVFAGR
ncbi:MAG: endopeptidase La [Gammaproteobacteria bacterium]|nr:MAG: endopeptidase La [Gammaproteobacteria bacterium]